MELTTKKEWNLYIKGVQCNIVFWTDENMIKEEHSSIYPHKGIWNSYVIIDKKSIPNDFVKLIMEIEDDRFDYNKFPLSMAYGITYYDVLRNTKGDIVRIKIGNDYNHIWNSEQFINENTIKKDLEETVEELLKLFPDLKVWSRVDGNYVKPNELDEYNKKAHKKLFK